MISVKAHWEQWCRSNCDLRVINAWKKAFSVILKVSPWRPNHMTMCLLHHSGESLQNGQLELGRQNWYFAWETHKDTAVSVWACQAGFWKSTITSCQLRSELHVVFHGVCKIALTEVLATQMSMMRRSKKVSSLELYKFNPLSPHYRSIAWELVHCYTWGRLRIVTVRSNTVGQQTFLLTTRIHSLLKNLRWQLHWLPRLTSLPGKSCDWWRTRDCSLGQPTENKID